MTKRGVLRGTMTGARRRIGAFIGGFEAGLSGRRLRKFQASRAHVNSLIGAAGPTINARARWLVRNNGYALNALESWAGNAVGDGIKPTSKVEDVAQKSAIQTLWQDWIAEADAEGLTDFYGLQRRAARELFLTGEVFFRFRPRLPKDGLSVPLQLQMLPSEMLPLTLNKELPGGGMIRQGIEFDLLGRRAAYYFLRRHPGDTTDPHMAGEIVRVPASEVIHVIDPVEAGQVRGVSRFAPAIVKLFFLDQYDDAELDRKKVSAMFAMFVTSPQTDGPLEATDEPLAVEPGQVVRLDAGEDITTSDPADSGATYEPFQYRTLLQVSAALGVPYSYVSNDLAKANFANSRLSIIEFRRRVSAWQHRVLIHQLCKRVGTTVHPDYGLEITGKYLGYAWVKYYDGTQTVADPMMVAKYGGHADYPYTADMVGSGNCYVIITLKANNTLYSGNPQFRIELYDLPLYDPRKDSTVGGFGPQRWADQTTWTGSENPVVMNYNIMRGIDVGGGVIWGGQVEEADVPFATWVTQMDTCDDIINGKPRYKAGFEVKLTEDNTPTNVIGELNKSCAASMADVGGKWIINSGAPQQPTLFITDDDIVVSESRTMSAVKAISTLHNAVSVSYVDPANIYQPKDADLYSDPVALAEDGGRRRVASLQLPAVTDADQVLRLQKAALADDRQKKVHSLTLPARLAGVEPIDVISWTSARNGYVAQAFQVERPLHDPTTLAQHVTMRAVNYADWL